MVNAMNNIENDPKFWLKFELGHFIEIGNRFNQLRIPHQYKQAFFHLLVESINEVIDVHSLRLAAVDLRLPRLLGLVLYVATILSFLLVGVANSSDRKRDFIPLLLFALAFVAVFMIIVDLDRPQEGLLTVGQTALSDLLQQMKMSAP